MQRDLKNASETLAFSIANLTSSNKKWLLEKLDQIIFEVADGLNNEISNTTNIFFSEFKLGISYNRALKDLKKKIGKNVDIHQKNLREQIKYLIHDFLTTSKITESEFVKQVISEQSKRIGGILKKFYRI